MGGVTTPPAPIVLDGTFVLVPQHDRLKMYLFKTPTESYGFSVGSTADFQYWAGGVDDGNHEFYTARSKRLVINSTGLAVTGRISASGGFIGTSPSVSSTTNTWVSVGNSSIGCYIIRDITTGGAGQFVFYGAGGVSTIVNNMVNVEVRSNGGVFEIRITGGTSPRVFTHVAMTV